MYFFLFEVFYCGTIIPIKLSIALMLIRIAQNRKAYVWSQWGMMTLFFLVDGGAMFYIIFQCKPVSYVLSRCLFLWILAPTLPRSGLDILLTSPSDMPGIPTRRDTVSQPRGSLISTTLPLL